MAPTRAATYSELSRALRRTGKYEEAYTRASEAITHEPSYWLHYEAAGLALEMLGRLEEAAGRLASACEMSDAQSPCAAYARVLLKAGRRSEAAQVAERAGEMVASVNGAYLLCRYFALAQDSERALQYLQRAVTLGWSDRAILEEEADLRDLRQDPRFAGILSGMAARKQDM